MYTHYTWNVTPPFSFLNKPVCLCNSGCWHRCVLLIPVLLFTVFRQVWKTMVLTLISCRSRSQDLNTTLHSMKALPLTPYSRCLPWCLGHIKCLWNLFALCIKLCFYFRFLTISVCTVVLLFLGLVCDTNIPNWFIFRLLIVVVLAVQILLLCRMLSLNKDRVRIATHSYCGRFLFRP